MKNFLMTSVAAATAMAMAPSAMAQDMAMDVELTTHQQTMYDGWSATNRAAYEGWPADVQTYYWTLTPMQSKAWWQLNDEQRVAIFNMAPTQRAATWQSIAQQLGERSATAPTATASTAATQTTNVRYQSGEVVQAVPTNAVSGEYPLCTNGRTDACMNPWEAGRRGAGVTKPLDYWPGRPASEIDKR